MDKIILIINVCAYDCSSEGRLEVYHLDIEINKKNKEILQMFVVFV